MVRLNKDTLDKKKQESASVPKNVIKVGMSSCGLAAGAQEIYDVLLKETTERNIAVAIKKCGCQGGCFAEPLVEVSVEGLPTVTYGKVNKEVALKIIDKHICNKMLVNDYIFDLGS